MAFTYGREGCLGKLGSGLRQLIELGMQRLLSEAIRWVQSTWEWLNGVVEWN